MRAEIISIGDELLIGQTINTNASWIGQECSKMGIRVVRVTTISDDESEIVSAVDTAFNHADVIFVTGGLGPTKDDITKHTLARYFGTELVRHEPTLKQIEDFFNRRNRPMLDVNIRQADLPASCIILPNPIGTAAGMWFEKEGKVLVSMPGVPYEMKGIMSNEVFPKLKDQYKLQAIYHRTIMTQGIGESFLADQIADWENRVREAGLSLAYLPSPGMVKLRLTSYEGEARSNEIDQFFKELVEQFPRYVYGKEDETIVHTISRLFIESYNTLGTVESCTGGSIAQQIISIPGASAFFMGSLVTYTNQLKHEIVDVDSEVLQQKGAVCQEVVEQMAVNGRVKLGVDYCISTSGIAGPDGGTVELPVGTVWIAVAFNDGVVSRQFSFGDNRERTIQMAVLSAMNMLRCQLLGIS
jgi:nicotinamide-nucleotide amidase